MNLSLLLREDSVNLKKARIQFTRDETYFSYFTNLQTNLTREVINISLIIKAPTYIYDCEGNKLDVTVAFLWGGTGGCHTPPIKILKQKF